MASEKYYLKQAAPPGSAFYYSVSQLKTAQRTAVLAVQAYYQQLLDAVYHANEASIAQIKFQWWRDEIASLLSEGKKFSHPLSHLLYRAVTNFSVKVEDLLALIDGVEEKIHIQPFMNFEELTIHIMRTAGLKEKILCDIVSPEVNIEVVYQLAMVEELFNFMQFLRRDVLKGIIFFPVDEMDRFAITVPMLEKLKMTRELEKFLAFQAEKIMNLHQGAVAKLTASDLRPLRSLLIRNKIAIVTLQEMKKERYNVMEFFTKLTPLRMWWLSIKA